MPEDTFLDIPTHPSDIDDILEGLMVYDFGSVEITVIRERKHRIPNRVAE
jgi:hypothetical protein